MSDAVINILSSKNVKKDFFKICKRLDNQYRQDLNKRGKTEDKYKLWEYILLSSNVLNDAEKLASKIITKLPKPPRIAVIDISDGFVKELEEAIPSDFKRVDDYFNFIYNTFLLTIKWDNSTPYESLPIPFFRSDIHNVSHALEEPLEMIRESIWQSEDGASISIVKRGKSEYCAVFSGKISEFAAENLPRDIQLALSCAVRSIVLLGPEHILGDDYESTKSRVFSHIPLASLETILNKQIILCDYLNSYFYSTLNEKVSFNKRMCNAVILLAASDEQTNNAAGLALSMSALEALLCDSQEKITNQLASHTSSLLEPIEVNRVKASKFIKKLYGIRSKLLHGESTASDEAQRLYARHIVAEVLDALNNMKQLGGMPNTPSKLFSELQKGDYKGGRQVLSIERNSVRSYWL